MRIYPLASLLVLAACVSAKPFVQEYNGDSVKIGVDVFLPANQHLSVAQPEADRICRSGGRRSAEFASYVPSENQYLSTLLFICRN